MYACVFAAPDRAIAMETKDLTHAKLGEDGEATVDSRRHVKEEGRGFMSSKRLALQPAEAAKSRAAAADRWSISGSIAADGRRISRK